VEGNLKALRRFHLLQKTLSQFGIEKERLQLVWTSASEGALLAEKIDTMTRELRELGPLGWKAVDSYLGPNNLYSHEGTKHTE
jgi:coenzyme F420-reducing hydrogenase delta subunit